MNPRNQSAPIHHDQAVEALSRQAELLATAADQLRLQISQLATPDPTTENISATHSPDEAASCAKRAIWGQVAELPRAR